MTEKESSIDSKTKKAQQTETQQDTHSLILVDYHKCPTQMKT